MLNKYICFIVKKTKEYERQDINGKVIKARRIICRKFIFCMIALVLTVSLKNGFADSFLNYCASVLSILIGLFMTILVFISDKFIIHCSDEELPAKEVLRKKQMFNYYKKFSYILGYTIILSIFCLMLIFLILIINTTFNPFEYSFTTRINIESIRLFFIGSMISLIRFIIIYFMINIFYYTLLAVSSLTTIINLKK